MTRRVRKHANPFSCTVDLGRLDRRALFGREAPLEVELGPATGSFLFARARNQPDTDFVGIEVRKPMVEQAMATRDAAGLTNAAVLYANANLNLRPLAEPGVIVRFHVHFPDPWPKKRHRKRRMLQPVVARDMATLLPIGGEVYAQSDVQPLAEEMFEILEADGSFEPRWRELETARPFPEFTDWERHHEECGEPVYRMLFKKVREPEGPIRDFELRPTGPL